LKKVTDLLGMRIYSDRAKYIGAVEDVVIEDREGTVVGLVFGRKAGKALTIPFSNIMAMGEIILVYSKRETGEATA
jgi:sporulation protein YlmC with PRC-barrel domain